MSPTLLDSFHIDENTKMAYLSQRNQLLSRKKDETFRDSRLRNYQTQDVNFLLSLKNKANFNQQRVGKTPETLVTMRELGEIKNAIIIAPGSTTYAWLYEYKFWTYNQDAIVVSSKMDKKKRTKIYKEFKGTIITTYGIVLNDIDLLLDRKIDTIVLDEAHRIRNYRNTRSDTTPATTKALINLSRRAKTRYALSGTPAPNEQHNIYGILAFLFPTLFKAYWPFIEYYFTIDDIKINWEGETRKRVNSFKSHQKQQELTEFLEIISIQRKRKEVMKWLKEIEPIKIILPTSIKVKKQYEELSKYFEIAEAGVEAINVLDRIIKARQLAIDPQLLGLKDKSVKTEWIKEYMEDYPEKSILIVSTFTSYLQQLHLKITDSVLLIGSTPNERRHEIQNMFNDKKIKIVLANLDVAKEGMKLYGADTMVIIDRSLTYTDNEQIMDRLLPVTEQLAKDKDPQEIIILLTDLFIEEYIDTALSNKKSRTDIINNYASALSSAAVAHRKKGG
jgi:SNF2 family DNA or RNA helicase